MVGGAGHFMGVSVAEVVLQQWGDDRSGGGVGPGTRDLDRAGAGRGALARGIGTQPASGITPAAAGLWASLPRRSWHGTPVPPAPLGRAAGAPIRSGTGHRRPLAFGPCRWRASRWIEFRQVH